MDFWIAPLWKGQGLSLRKRDELEALSRPRRLLGRVAPSQNRRWPVGVGSAGLSDEILEEICWVLRAYGVVRVFRVVAINSGLDLGQRDHGAGQYVSTPSRRIFKQISYDPRLV